MPYFHLRVVTTKKLLKEQIDYNNFISPSHIFIVKIYCWWSAKKSRLNKIKAYKLQEEGQNAEGANFAILLGRFGGNVI